MCVCSRERERKRERERERACVHACVCKCLCMSSSQFCATLCSSIIFFREKYVSVLMKVILQSTELTIKELRLSLVLIHPHTGMQHGKYFLKLIKYGNISTAKMCTMGTDTQTYRKTNTHTHTHTQTHTHTHTHTCTHVHTHTTFN